MPTFTIPASVSVDTDDLRTVLRIVGFPEDQIDIAQAIAQAESRDAANTTGPHAYEDAVGDVSLVNAKFGPSVGMFQIRSLRHPASYGGLDLWRHAWPLRNRFFNASAAFAISKGGVDWAPWATFTSGSYKAFLGQSPKILTGRTGNGDWWR